MSLLCGCHACQGYQGSGEQTPVNHPLALDDWVTPQLCLLLLWAGTSSPGEEVHGRHQAREGRQGHGREGTAAPGGTGFCV